MMGRPVFKSGSPNSSLKKSDLTNFTTSKVTESKIRSKSLKINRSTV